MISAFSPVSLFVGDRHPHLPIFRCPSRTPAFRFGFLHSLKPSQFSIFWQLGKLRLQQWYFPPPNIPRVCPMMWWLLGLKDLWNALSAKHVSPIAEQDNILIFDTSHNTRSFAADWWFARIFCLLVNAWNPVYSRKFTKIAFWTFAPWWLRSFAPQRATNAKKLQLCSELMPFSLLSLLA